MNDSVNITTTVAKDTCFNVGSRNVTRRVEVDANKFTLKGNSIKKKGREESKNNEKRKKARARKYRVY